MCHAEKCRTCGKTTWSGCGQHVAHVKSQVPADQWCPGHAAGPNLPNGGWNRKNLHLFLRPSTPPDPNPTPQPLPTPSASSQISAHSQVPHTSCTLGARSRQ